MRKIARNFYNLKEHKIYNHFRTKFIGFLKSLRDFMCFLNGTVFRSLKSFERNVNVNKQRENVKNNLQSLKLN